MTEIHDARELHRVLTAKQEGDKRFASRWAWWAPGDFTRYRVTHVVAYPPGFKPHLGQVHGLVVSAGLDNIIIPRPGSTPWTPESFLERFGEKHAGWWAGIRPVLAAFSWTSTRTDDVRYNSRDADEIGRLLPEA